MLLVPRFLLPSEHALVSILNLSCFRRRNLHAHSQDPWVALPAGNARNPNDQKAEGLTSTAPLGRDAIGSRLLEVANVLFFRLHTNQQPRELAPLPPA